MSLQLIEKLINNLNQTNLILSQYQNFQLWLIKRKITKTTLTLEIITTDSSENSELMIVTTIQLPSTDKAMLQWCYESLLLAEQQTLQKEMFWKKLIEQELPLYQLEPRSKLLLLTKRGNQFFNNKNIIGELNYYNYNILNYNILIILLAWKKINMTNIKQLVSLNSWKNLISTIKQQLNLLTLTTYKLLIIKCNNLNKQILTYFRTLLVLTHQHQLFGYNKNKDYWALTELGKKLFYQINYEKFIIKDEMMEANW